VRPNLAVTSRAKSSVEGPQLARAAGREGLVGPRLQAPMDAKHMRQDARKVLPAARTPNLSSKPFHSRRHASDPLPHVRCYSVVLPSLPLFPTPSCKLALACGASWTAAARRKVERKQQLQSLGRHQSTRHRTKRASHSERAVAAVVPYALTRTHMYPS
jgi:hypothetical protein